MTRYQWRSSDPLRDEKHPSSQIATSTSLAAGPVATVTTGAMDVDPVPLATPDEWSASSNSSPSSSASDPLPSSNPFDPVLADGESYVDGMSSDFWSTSIHSDFQSKALGLKPDRRDGAPSSWRDPGIADEASSAVR
jgi:hypothetical protein